VRIARRPRLTPFFGASVLSLIAMIAALAMNASARWLIAIPIAMVVALMVRAFWHAAATVALADDIMTRVMLDAGAAPLGQRAAEVADRVVARRRLAEALAPHIGPPTRHAE